MRKVIDIRGRNGKGLLCRFRIDTRKNEIEVAIGRKKKYVLITFRNCDYSVNYYDDDPFASKSPQ